MTSREGAAYLPDHNLPEIASAIAGAASHWPEARWNGKCVLCRSGFRQRGPQRRNDYLSVNGARE
jgi:hypothetical protein